MSAVTIPYKPRYPEVHQALEQHRFSVLVAHRRFGKTVLVVNHLLKCALMGTKADGHFAYIAPFRNQAKDVAWAYLKRYSAPIPGRKINEGELCIQIPAAGGSAKIRIFGADNPDALRGLYFDGVVLDEVAQMKPEVWEEILQPALADRRGFAVFIGTPKGINLFSEQYYRAQEREARGDADWVAMSYPVTATSALDAEEVERLRAELSENAWRQEMLCDFNASSDDVLIPLSLVEQAQSRHLNEQDISFSPLVLGVDVARFGDDASVIFPRRGLCAYPPIVLTKLDNMALADRIAYEMRAAQACFIDAGGGAGVIDRLRQLGCAVNEVHFGGRALHPERFVNRRMEMWQGMRDWLEQGGQIPRDSALMAELSAPTYSYDNRGLLRLEAKEAVKERLLRSPDRADALALTFAAPVAALDAPQINREAPYDPLAW